MKRLNVKGASPQQKLMHVNKGFGNMSIKDQQGSTVEVYDIEEIITGKSDYDFFINARAKQFPFTNLTRGVLQPQESFVMERAYITLITEDANGDVISQQTFDNGSSPFGIMGEFRLDIDNDRTVKSLPLRSFIPQFNPDADSQIANVYEFDTQIVIPPLLEFKVTLKFPDGALNDLVPAEGRTLLAVTLGGPGAIFAPKNNY